MMKTCIGLVILELHVHVDMMSAMTVEVTTTLDRDQSHNFECVHVNSYVNKDF